MKKQKKYFSGFTLIELIIVITILSILATIAFLSFQNYTKDARNSIRAMDLKTIYQGLQLYKVDKNKFPYPEEYVEITGFSNQGYAKEGISSMININKQPLDPLSKKYYTYSTNKNNTKIQLMALLEGGSKLLLTKSELLPKVYGADNEINDGKLTYTYGDKIGILLEEETKKPIQEIYSEPVLDLITNTGTYSVVFTNTKSNTGTITGSGEELLRTIIIIQNSCLLGEKVVNDGDSITGYNSESVGFGEKCSSIQRECRDGILTGNSSYQYSSCIVLSAANCNNNEPYNGYYIQDLNHDETIEVLKIISLGQSTMNVSCFNGKLTYGNEVISCGENIYDDTTKTCNSNLCSGTKPINAQLNGEQKYGENWNYNTNYGDCNFICKEGYSWVDNDCIINRYIVSGNVSNGGNATINICGKNTIADVSGNFSIEADYNTNCNNLEVIKTGYNCSVLSNGPSNLISNVSVSSSCSEANYEFNYIISSNTSNYNLRNAAISAGWNGVLPLTANITINSGIYVYSTSTSTPAFSTGILPSGSIINIVNNGNIVGRGGNGGKGGVGNVTGPGSAGGAGGPAFKAQSPVILKNNGMIAGGGGGGGGQGLDHGDDSGCNGGGGGGGRGFNGGSGGASGGSGASSGGAGSVSAGGTGGSGSGGWGWSYSGRKGGNGGGWGAAGAKGNSGQYTGGNGGSGGASIQGNVNITWQNTGTRYGAIQQ